MEQNITVRKRNNFVIAGALVASPGFKISLPFFLSMIIDMEDNLDQPPVRAIEP